MEPNREKNVIRMDEVRSSPVDKGFADVGLVKKAKDGDVGAFEQLFEKYQRRVYNIVYGIVADENEAADLTQEVFVKVYRSLGRLKAEEAFFSWLRTVAVNTCRDYIRRRPPRTESIDEPVSFADGEMEKQIPDEAQGPEAALIGSETDRAVRRAIASLSYERRLVVTLHHLEGMDVKEIAKVTGAPVGTVKSRLARARDELKRKLIPYVDVR